MTEEEIAAHIVARLDTMDDPAMIEAYRAHPRVVEVIAHWGRTRPDWATAIRSAFFGRLELLQDETRIRPSGMTAKPDRPHEKRRRRRR